MADKKGPKESDVEQYIQWENLSKEHWSHWRAWGSWFSWGSPIGLGLFFMSLAATFWIVMQAI